MICIETAHPIADRQTELGDVPWNRGWICSPGDSIAARFEAMSVPTGSGKIGVISVVEGPAVFDRSHRLATDEIKPVVAVEPRTATSQHIACMADVVAVDTKPIHVPHRQTVQPAIVVSVAVQHQIALAAAQIPTDPHPVMHGQLFKTISIAAIDAETF